MSSHNAICYSVCMAVGLCVCSTACARDRSGAEIYHAICASCHQDGVFDAPKLDDLSAWKPRLAKGKKVLYQSAFKGLGDKMPARNDYEGRLSDSEVYAAVNYMVRMTGQYASASQRVAATHQ